MYKYTLLKTSTWNLVSSFIVFLLLVGNANLRSHLLPFDAKSPGFVPWPSSQFHIFLFWCLQFSTWKHNHSHTQKLKLAFLNWQSHFLMSFMSEISCICSHHVYWSPSWTPHPVFGHLLVPWVFICGPVLFTFPFTSLSLSVDRIDLSLQSMENYLYLESLYLWFSAFLFPFHITFTFSWQNWSLSPVYGKLLVSPAIHHVQCFLSHNNCQEPTASRTYLLFLQISPQVQDL